MGAASAIFGKLALDGSVNPLHRLVCSWMLGLEVCWTYVDETSLEALSSNYGSFHSVRIYLEYCSLLHLITSLFNQWLSLFRTISFVLTFVAGAIMSNFFAKAMVYSTSATATITSLASNFSLTVCFPSFPLGFGAFPLPFPLIYSMYCSLPTIGYSWMDALWRSVDYYLVVWLCLHVAGSLRATSWCKEGKTGLELY